MRKVLFIAHYFPPLVSSGSFRPVKFVKYLEEFSWQATVISTKPVDDSEIDLTLSDDIPDNVCVLRILTPLPKPRDRLIRWLVKFAPKFGGSIQCAFDKSWQPSSTLLRVFRLFIKSILFPLTLIQYPPIDPEFYWSMKIIPPAVKLIRADRMAVIFTTSAPWSSLLSGLLLKIVTRKPWVADLRDPWTKDEHRYRIKGWRRVFDKFIEKLCLANADIVIGVTPKWLEDLKGITGEYSAAGKFELITNGYDELDFCGIDLPGLKYDSEIIISHVGSMFQGGLEPLLFGIQQVNGSLRGKIKFRFTGYMHPEDQALLDKSDVSKLIEFQPRRINHTQSVQQMRESHVLFLSLPFDYYPGKLFEYMRLGRPVLAVVPGGSAGELIKQAGIGFVVDHAEPEHLSEVLQQIATDYDQFTKMYYQPDWGYISQFERRNLTRQLSEVLNRVVTQ